MEFANEGPTTQVFFKVDSRKNTRRRQASQKAQVRKAKARKYARKVWK